MSYFNTAILNTGEPGSITAPEYDGLVPATESAIMDIVLEGLREDYQLQAAMQIADSSLTLTAVRESAEAADIALESVVGSTFTKIKDGLKSLWAKVKAWFKSVKERLTMMFSKGKTFISKYKKQIQEKPARGFEYTGYPWTIEAGNTKATAAINAVGGAVDSVVGKLGSTVNEIVNQGKNNGLEEYTGSDVQEQIVKALGGSISAGANADMSDVKKAIFAAYRGGKEEGETEELKEFSKVTKDTLIGMVEKSDKAIKVITDAEKVVDKTFAESIKLISKAETEVGKLKDSDLQGSDNSASAVSKRRANAATAVSRIAFATRYGQTLNSAVASAAVESISAGAAEAERVLKRFVNYKGTKESFQGTEEFGSESTVIESLMNVTGI